MMNSENRKSEYQDLRGLVYKAAQWTWGLPQSLCGLAVSLYYRKYPQYDFHGAHVTVWPHKSSLSLGMYLFLTDDAFHYYKDQKSELTEKAFTRGLLVHEYGHTIQSLMYGPLYLIAVGLPSILWANLPPLRRRRKEKSISYYSVYPEKQANKLGERFTGEKSIGTPIS